MFFFDFPRWPGERPKFIADWLSYLHWRITQYQERRFDDKYGMETSASESKYLANVESPNRDFAVPYEAIQLDVFVDMVTAVKRLLCSLEEYHFIDLGSGKGRALVYAAEFGFGKCTGVEFSDELNKIAQRNLNSYTKISGSSCRFSLVCEDAADFEIPREDTVLFMYNPFGYEVMRLILGKLKEFSATSSRKLVVLYRNPTCASDFEDNGLVSIEANKSFQIFAVSR